MSDHDFAYFLVAVGHLLLAAHAGGRLFQALRQPRVVGEISGGLVLGPTLLASLSPDWHATVFGREGTQVALGAVNKIGLMLLMFCSGLELPAGFPRAERRTAAFVIGAGTLLPVAVALACGRVVDFTAHYGPAATPLAFDLVVAIAVAVTSIPVLSKIMMELKLLDTPFARVVLTAAVVEDVMLYVLLSIAVAMALPLPRAATLGLAHWLGVPDGTWSVVYHVVVTLVFFALALSLGPTCYRRITQARFKLVGSTSHLGYLLTFLVVASGLAMFLDVQLMFGAFLAGVVASTSTDPPEPQRRAAKAFANAFFVPLFFAMVGLRLNLRLGVPWIFFAAFFVLACVIKAGSVYIGARWAGVARKSALNLAAAMNARGGPGIVLASVAIEAGIINDGFYACLVLLAMLTSLMAGSWLGRAVRAGPLL
ncbi:MAG TPA: cation:proton antiporter [Vicinamibacteria bacterium]|nr:cation:proton antiporter [Vicinamibacteria bacterium]